MGYVMCDMGYGLWYMVYGIWSSVWAQDPRNLDDVNCGTCPSNLRRGPAYHAAGLIAAC